MDEARRKAAEIEARAKTMSTDELLGAFARNFRHLGRYNRTTESSLQECESWDQFEAHVHFEELRHRLNFSTGNKMDQEIVTTYTGPFSRPNETRLGDPQHLRIIAINGDGKERVLYCGIEFAEPKLPAGTRPVHGAPLS